MPIVVTFLYSFCLAIFFVSNDQFMMLTASPDIRGMIGGCMMAFRESGFSIGIAMINLINDIFMGEHWEGTIPIDPLCQDA